MPDVTPEATPGQAAYEAYAAASGGKSLVSGATLPKWHQQPEIIRDAWQRAAAAVMLMAQAAVDYDELARLREEVAHLSAALAGDNEGVRLWMLDCGNLTDKHRRGAAFHRAEADGLRVSLNRTAATLTVASEALTEIADGDSKYGDYARKVAREAVGRGTDD